jgi:hypothetical protein
VFKLCPCIGCYCFSSHTFFMNLQKCISAWTFGSSTGVVRHSRVLNCYMSCNAHTTPLVLHACMQVHGIHGDVGAASRNPFLPLPHTLSISLGSQHKNTHAPTLAKEEEGFANTHFLGDTTSSTFSLLISFLNTQYSYVDLNRQSLDAQCPLTPLASHTLTPR